MKQYEKLTFRDSFMFNAVMKDAELCQGVLETLLQTPIGELNIPSYEKSIKETVDGKAIRLDIYAEEKETGKLIDAEMQNLNRKSAESLCLPKRTRYYQALLDTSNLHENDNYSKLRDTNIVFICTFDPFMRGLPRYRFLEICESLTDLKLESGTSKVFINTTADQSILSEEMKNLFEYINSGIVSDSLTQRIDCAVRRARMDSEMRAEYMRNTLFYQDAIREGKAEGREEGRAEGRAEGFAEGAAKATINERAETISRLYKLGWSSANIAEFYGITIEQVEELASVSNQQ